jgi:hypothetical protein
MTAMPGGVLDARAIVLGDDERRTLAAAARRRAPGSVLAATQSGVIDVADPAVRTWLGARRDALLARLRDDEVEELGLVARLLSDALDAARAGSPAAV